MAKQEPEQVLSILKQNLEQWGRTVPPEATRFHERRTDLHARVNAEENRWPFGPRAEEAASLAREAQALSPVADGLASTLKRVQTVKAGVEQAGSLVGRLNDTALLQWFDQWRAHWHHTIQSVGRAAEKEQDLGIDIQVIQTVEWEVTEIRSSVQIFSEAHSLLAQFTGHLKAAVLRADLSELRVSLLREPPTLAFRDAVARAMASLKAIANEPAPQPPADLSTAYRRATEAESWADAMGVDSAAAHDLLRNVADVQHDPSQWSGDSVRSLLSQTHDLATHLRGEALRGRAEAAEALRADMVVVQEACGALPDLADEIRRIELLPEDEPYHHEQWKKVWPAVRKALFQEIGARRKDIFSWVTTRRSHLTASLTDLASRALPTADSHNRTVLKSEIEAATGLPEAAEQILERLHAMARWIAAAEGLESSARAAADTVGRRRRAVESRHAELTDHEQSLGLPLVDWTAALQEMKTPSGLLESLLDRLTRMEKQNEDRSLAIVRKCRENVAEDVELCRKATALIQTVLPGISQNPPPVWSADVTAVGAMKVRGATRRAREETLALVATAAAQLTVRIPDVRTRLEEAMSLPDASDEHRISAQELVDVLVAESWKSLGPLEAFERLKRHIGRADVLLHDLTARENEIVRLRTEIDKLFATTSEEGLGKYLPDTLAQRARALRRGVKDKPRALGAAIRQLEAAHTLFSSALDHGRRIAVARFVDALMKVNAEVARDSAFATRAEPALLEVRLIPHDQFPPADVRERVIQLAASVPQQRGHRG